MAPSTGTITIREADTVWREEGGWFDARWHFCFDRLSVVDPPMPPIEEKT